MVYLEAVYLGWECVVESWTQHVVPNKLKLPNYAKLLNDLFMKYVDPILKFLHSECRQRIEAFDINLVQSCIRFMESMLNPEFGFKMEEESMEHVLNMHFIFAVIW